MNSPRLRQVLLLFYLFIYLIAGFYTELRLLKIKPLPDFFLEDFGYYENGLKRALAGEDAYSDRGIGTGFLYPPQALLFVQVFHSIQPRLMRISVYTVVNLFLMAAMVFGVIRYYGYSLRRTWYWFVLCFGFAPFLEMLHIGQINMFPLFGIFVMFAYENRQPIVSGLGLSLAIVTKVTPVFFFAYLLAQKRLKVILVALVSVALLLVLAGLIYGFEPMKSYPATFSWMLSQFPMSPNSQSFVAKLTVADPSRFAELVTHFPETLRAPVTIYNNFMIHNYKLIHRGVTIYLLALIAISSLLTYLGRQPKEACFIVTSLAMTFSPNILWYHHFVFILLPLLIWMGWSKQKTAVVIWCLLGLLVVQLDRHRWSNGLLIQGFGQITLLAILIWQIKEYINSHHRQPKYASFSTVSGG